MRNLGVINFEVVAKNQYGVGIPDVTLNTYQEYIEWYARIILAESIDPNKYLTPLFVTAVDSQPGGSFLFSPNTDGVNSAVSEYEYRLTNSNGDLVQDWKTATSFRLEIPNDTFNPGGVQIRRKASGSKLASDILTNLQTFTEYLYPLVIQRYYFVDKVLHMIIKVNSQGYIAMISNTYNNGYRGDPAGGPYQPGVYDYVFDFSKFGGQYQVIALNKLGQVDYTTPQFQTTVPN